MQPVRELRSEDGSDVTSCALSGDGGILAFATQSGIVTVVDVAAGTQLLRFAGRDYWDWNLALSPDGKCLAYKVEEESIEIHDLEQQRGSGPLLLGGHVRACLVLPHGRGVVAAGAGGKMRHFGMQGELVADISTNWEQYINWDNLLYIALGSNSAGSRVTGVSDFLEAYSVNLEPGSSVKEMRPGPGLDHVFREVRVCVETDTLVGLKMSGELWLYSLSGDRERTILTAPKGKISSFCLVSEGRTILAGTDAGDVCALEGSTGAVISNGRADSYVRCWAWSGTKAALGTEGGMIQIYDAALLEYP